MSGITIALNTAAPLLERVKNGAQAAGLALVGARAVAVITKDHLVQLDAERHQFGRHYYLQAARSVASRAAFGASSGMALVTITQTGFRQRLLGGPIAPKAGRKFLTLPAQPEAHAKRAREFHDLDFAIALDENGALRPALVQRVSTAITIRRRKKKDGTFSFTVKPGEVRGGKVMFWLARRVMQKPDSTVLPPTPLVTATATEAIRRRIVRLETRAGGAPLP